MGQSSINGPFSMAMLNNQRVDVYIFHKSLLGQSRTKQFRGMHGRGTRSELWSYGLSNGTDLDKWIANPM